MSGQRVGLLGRKSDTGVGLLLLSFAVSALLRVPYFQHAFTFIDEAWWAVGAQVRMEGGRLYQDVWLDKQPPIFWLCTVLQNVLGSGMDAIHLGSLLLVLAISVLLFLIGSTFFSRTVGGAAAILYALASTTYYIPRIIGMNVESLMVLFTTAAMLFFLLGMLRGRNYGFWGAGLFSSLAVMTKPVAFEQLGLFVLLIISAGFHKPAHMEGIVPSGAKDDRPSMISRLLWLGLGSLCALIPIFVYMTFRGNMAQWWEQCVLYGFSYIAQPDVSSYFRNFVLSPIVFSLIYGWLWLCIGQSRRGAGDRKKAHTILACWTASAFLGVIVGVRFYANYIIQVIPPMSLLGALGLVHVWNGRHQLPLRRIGKLACAAFLVSFLWFHSRTFAHWYFFFSPESHQRSELWGMCRENRQLDEIANYLEVKTKVDDRLFIWGSRAELYILSDRMPATPYMDYDVTANVPQNAASPESTQAIVERLRQTRPRYIVDVQGRARLVTFPPFQEFIERDYILDKEMHSAWLYRLRDAEASGQ